MPPDSASTETADQNVDVYSSEQAIKAYEEQTASTGLTVEEEEIVERYFGPPDSRVLDVGCGTGRTTKPLSEKGFDVTGVDISREMISTARSLFPDIDFQVGDVSQLQFSNASFDAALFSYSGIDCLSPPEKRSAAFRELHRVLKPAGVLAFSTHNSLYALPAALLDREFFRRYYIDSGNIRRIFDRYKKDESEWGLMLHFSTPLRHLRELRNNGFSVEDFGSRNSVLRYFETRPYYVARKPHEP